MQYDEVIIAQSIPKIQLRDTYYDNDMLKMLPLKVKGFIPQPNLSSFGVRDTTTTF